jgi:hypothetical protein
MATYGQPRRLNAVSITMILLVCAGAYWMWRFFPAHFDAWTVDHLLKEAASETYKLNRLQEPQRTKELRELVTTVRGKIQKQANVTDPNLDVTLDISEDGNNCAVSADYSVVVTHPGITSTTTVHFHRTEKADIKRVQWE